MIPCVTAKKGAKKKAPMVAGIEWVRRQHVHAMGIIMESHPRIMVRTGWWEFCAGTEGHMLSWLVSLERTKRGDCVAVIWCNEMGWKSVNASVVCNDKVQRRNVETKAMTMRLPNALMSRRMGVCCVVRVVFESREKSREKSEDDVCMDWHNVSLVRSYLQYSVCVYYIKLVFALIPLNRRCPKCYVRAPRQEGNGHRLSVAVRARLTDYYTAYNSILLYVNEVLKTTASM